MDTPGRGPDGAVGSGDLAAERNVHLRALAQEDPAAAGKAAWTYIEHLRTLATTDHDEADKHLNELFRSGDPVDALDGPTEGILVMTTTNPLTDAAVKLITSLWMPWQGKRFDSPEATGNNRMTESSALASKLLWPFYSMKDARAGKLAFDFKTYIEAGKEDPDCQVLVIDYGAVDSNPRLLIRSIRDELVEIVPGVFLGKILFRLPGDRYSKVGYFALRTDS